MDDIRAYLVTASLVATGHLSSVKNLLENYSLDHRLVLSILLALSPDLTDPKEFNILSNLEALNKSKHSSSEYLLEMLSSHENLQGLVDLEPEILTSRFHALKSYINEQESIYAWGTDAQPFTEFVRARTRKAVALLEDLHFNDVLFEVVDDDAWYNKNIVPLEYLMVLKAIPGKPDLQHWEALGDLNQIIAIYNALQTNHVSVIQDPYKRFLAQMDGNILLQFLQEFESIDENLELFTSFAFEVYKRGDTALVEQILKIYYRHSEINSKSLITIFQALHGLRSEVSSHFYQRLVDLVQAANIIQFDKSLETLDSLLLKEETQREILNTVLFKVSTSSTTKQISDIQSLHQKIFTKVSDEEFTTLLTQRLLNLRLYSMITYKIDESLIVKNFWKLFQSASNGSKERGDLQNAYESLALIKPPSDKILSLKKLVDSIDELTTFSLYLEKGQPFRPRDLLSLENGLNTLLERILELNDNAYSDPEQLLDIFDGIGQGLELTRIDILTIKLACIQSALTHDDFYCALELSSGIFKDFSASEKTILSKNWFVFFQVSKFISPVWLETETPSDVIQVQMGLISEIVKIVPLDSVQVVIAQWNSLELELSLKKETQNDDSSKQSQWKNNDTNGKDHRSLDQRLARALSSTANQFLNDERNLNKSLSGMLMNGLTGLVTGSK